MHIEVTKFVIVFLSQNKTRWLTIKLNNRLCIYVKKTRTAFALIIFGFYISVSPFQKCRPVWSCRVATTMLAKSNFPFRQ